MKRYEGASLPGSRLKDFRNVLYWWSSCKHRKAPLGSFLCLVFFFPNSTLKSSMHCCTEQCCAHGCLTVLHFVCFTHCKVPMLEHVCSMFMLSHKFKHRHDKTWLTLRFLFHLLSFLLAIASSTPLTLLTKHGPCYLCASTALSWPLKELGQ